MARNHIRSSRTGPYMRIISTLRDLKSVLQVPEPFPTPAITMIGLTDILFVKEVVMLGGL